MIFQFSIEKEQNTKTRMPSLGLTQLWKTLTILYHRTYLMDSNIYHDLINYLTTLTYPTDYDEKRKTHLRKTQPNTLLKTTYYIDEIKKVTYE